jgi:anti-sigma factor RsiW
MMSCHELADLLIDYVSGEMPPDHRERLERHLQACEPCLIYLDTYRQTIFLTRKLPIEPLPQACEQRLRAFIGQTLKDASQSMASE